MIKDPVLLDLRRYEAACDRADQDGARIEEEVLALTSKGYSHYPLDPANVESFLALGIDYPEELAALMESGDDCAAGKWLRERCIQYWQDAARDLVE